MPLFNDAIQQIITSASIPSNLRQGLIWNELDSNNNLIESWIYSVNTKWVSTIKTVRASHQGTGNTVTYFALDSRYDYLLLEWIVNFLSLKTMVAGDSLTANLDRYPFTGTGSTLKTVTATGLSPSACYGSVSPLNVSISPIAATSNFLRSVAGPGGTSPNYLGATELKYQLVRK